MNPLLPLFRRALLVISLLAAVPANSQPARDVDMDCAGTLENNEHGIKRDATATVMIMAGHVTVMIKPFGYVIGQITKTEANVLLFDPVRSNFTIDGLNPHRGHVDRVNARVSIFYPDPKTNAMYTFWFKCTVRKPQF